MRENRHIWELEFWEEVKHGGEAHGQTVRDVILAPLLTTCVTLDKLPFPFLLPYLEHGESQDSSYMVGVSTELLHVQCQAHNKLSVV